MKNKTLVALTVVIIAVGIFWWQMAQAPNEVKEVARTDYKNILYEIEGQSHVLADGVFEAKIANSADKIIVRYFGNDVTGDFNGDNFDDIIFLLTYNTGGSGTFYYVVVALKTANGYVGTNGVFLGDRIAPQSTEFRDGEIIVNFADRKSDGPMTATPSVGVSKYLKVENGKLVEVLK